MLPAFVVKVFLDVIADHDGTQSTTGLDNDW